MGNNERAAARDEAAAIQDRFIRTLVIAAVRLAQVDIDRSSPKLVYAIGASVRLARQILEAVLGSARG